MTVEDGDYHERRAADERAQAERTSSPEAALAHLTLARLHGERTPIRMRMPTSH